MASFKPVIRKGQINKQGLSNIKIQIVHEGKTDYIATDYFVDPNFMKPNGEVKEKYPNSDYINKKLSQIVYEYKRDMLRYSEKGYKFNSAKEIKNTLILPPQKEITDFFQYCTHRIQQLKDNKKGTAVTYENSITQFKKVLNIPVLPFSAINKNLLELFEAKAKLGGRSQNTVGIYLRSVRALFYDAMDELNIDGIEPVITNNPFRKFQIKTTETRKRSIESDIIQKIRDYTPDNKMDTIARDMFMLTFYLIGINTKDLFYSRKLVNNRLEYTRFKGGRFYSIKIEPEAAEILNRYKGEKYILCFADYCQEERTEPRRKHHRIEFQYANHRAFQKMINERIKEICKTPSLDISTEIHEKISTYYARHSWATIALNNCEITKNNISLCLGHGAKVVTDTYLDIDLRLIDKCNRAVLDHIQQAHNS